MTRPPVTGHHRPASPAKDRHMEHFEEALKDALRQWTGERDDNVEVTFHATVTANPGGIKEYRATIKL